MKIEINVPEPKKIKEMIDSVDDLLKLDLQNIELDLTEENIIKAKNLKALCDKGWLRANIKIVSSDGTELTVL